MALLPESPLESQWQTVLAEQPIGVAAYQHYEDERLQIEQHVGAYIVKWAFVDSLLGTAVSVWANPTAPSRLLPALYSQSTSNKINILNALLPIEWVDGVELIRHLREANTYRNLLAHGVLGQSGSYEGKSVGWHFNKGRLGQNVTELDMPQLRSQFRKIQVLQTAALVAMGPPFIETSGTPLSDVSPRSTINDCCLSDGIIQSPGVWKTRDERNEFRALVLKMFPGSPAQG
jgi:hypothetical protein